MIWEGVLPLLSRGIGRNWFILESNEISHEEVIEEKHCIEYAQKELLTKNQHRCVSLGIILVNSSTLINLNKTTTNIFCGFISTNDKHITKYMQQRKFEFIDMIQDWNKDALTDPRYTFDMKISRDIPLYCTTVLFLSCELNNTKDIFD